MDRKQFIRSMAVLSGAAVLSSEKMSASEPTSKEAASPVVGHNEKMSSARQARFKAAHKVRRVIVNNDGDDSRWEDPFDDVNIITPELFLSKRTLGLAEAPVDTVFYCDGRTVDLNHRSKYVGPTRIFNAGYVFDAFKELGTDSLELTVDYLHQHGKEVFWSIRMNDCHDSTRSSWLGEFKKSHPELLVGRVGKSRIKYPAKKIACLDYTLPQVRDLIFNIFEEVIVNYDVDGVEMDFFRHPAFFLHQFCGEPVTAEECGMMTDLVRRIRKALDKQAARRGRPMLLAIRVPDSPEYSRAIGVDWEQWLKEDLIDLMTGADYFKLEPWRNFADLGRKYGVQTFATLENRRLLTQDPQYRGKTSVAGRCNELTDMGQWRNEALAAWTSGINGMYVFNRFEADDPVLREVSSPALLKKLGAEPVESYGNHASNNDPGMWLKGGRSYWKAPDGWFDNAENK